ncbi:MAG: methionine synthase [Candidatus Rokuibacteriota bacterium]|nr:MAG: methionine synthase [Candidatus Rokubacteria bacterium]
MSAALLPTAVVGSYSMPGWLERVKNDYLQRRISRHDYDEIHDAAVKAALKDQEVAGVDIVSDGELRRDNMIDYFAMRLPGVQIDHASKRFYYDFYDSVIRNPMPTASLGLVEDFRFLRRFTERRVKVSVTGPHSLVKRIRNEHYRSEEAFALDIARVMNLELKELVKAGATDLQIDEPYYSGFAEDVGWGIGALNALVDGVGARLSLHVCYGNRYGKPSWEGSYRYLFPAVLEARVDQLTLEFGRRGEGDVELFKEFDPPFALGLGVIDVKSHDVESPAIVAERIRKALEIVSPERLGVNPDCGLLHLPRDVAFAKLRAMVEGTSIVRGEIAT